ncbi:hypothetical protein KAT80_02915 [Candidatus Pacearchaeota archaeon]|nr:hypothetical protein [Candidatus Pacearchaeota archaeon]
MRRKVKQLKLKEKREKRTESVKGKKKQKYKKMVEKDELGSTDLKKYRIRYPIVKEHFPNLSIISPDDYHGKLPTRTDYTQLNICYNRIK